MASGLALRQKRVGSEAAEGQWPPGAGSQTGSLQLLWVQIWGPRQRGVECIWGLTELEEEEEPAVLEAVSMASLYSASPTVEEQKLFLSALWGRSLHWGWRQRWKGRKQELRHP